MITKCPDCGSPITACVEVYEHYDVEDHPDGPRLSHHDHESDHGYETMDLACSDTDCDWQMRDVTIDCDIV
jgi:hypothetical protein